MKNKFKNLYDEFKPEVIDEVFNELFNDLNKNKSNDTIIMNQNEYFNKTKSLLTKIYTYYSQGWKHIPFKENEYPDEKICDECTGSNSFINDNNETIECIQNREEGECYYFYCDYEEIGFNLQNCINDILNLLLVDEINNE
ncbi:MAG TPA: hypothetical protein PLN85_00550 [archaeon]|jgi:hypothetical protein|nr:hypothetical protein [archaeon]